MNKWNPNQKPAGIAEQHLLEAILSGLFADNGCLLVGRDAISTHKEFA